MTRSLEIHLTRLLYASLIVQLAVISTMNSPNCDEIGHLGAGLYTLDTARFDIYRVNPPLVRSIAAVPVALCGPHRDYRSYSEGPLTRVEWQLGRDLISANPDHWEWYFPLARWALFPLVALGGAIVYRWSSDLNGTTGGLISLALYCFCPNTIAWSATINPDSVAGVLGLLAGYAFWKWLRNPSWRSAVIAGCCLGLVELTKFSFIILIPLWPVLWLLWRWSSLPGDSSTTREEAGVSSNDHLVPQPGIIQLAVILLLAIYVVNLGYGFEGTGTPLREYRFVSKSLTGETKIPSIGNRFRDSWLGLVPMPIPTNYLSGIDLQKLDFERGTASYLNGEWLDQGHWYYYLYAALLKIPLGTWLLGLVLITGRLASRRQRTTAESDATSEASRGPLSVSVPSSTIRDELVVLGPALALLVLVSSQTGLNSYFRYVLPCFPFIYVWLGQLGSSMPRRWRKTDGSLPSSKWPQFQGLIVITALAWSVCSNLSVFPFCQSYFNELAGGPTNGHRYLIDANIDWGQDAYVFRQWLRRHPEVTHIHTSLRCPLPALMSDREDPHMPDLPTPGWYAISIHQVHDRSERHLYFLKLKPVAMAGYSIYIYHVTPDDANRLRRDMGLPSHPATD